ncbi:MAG: L,D-transpeptidase [Verrucomicrobiota bacterium]
MNRLISTILALGLAAMAGCASYDTRLTSTATKYLGQDGSIVSRSSASTLADKNSYWDGAGVSGEPSILIDLSEQTASFYKGSKLVGVSAISSGREGRVTPVGNYKVVGKELEHHSNLYGDYVDAAGNVLVRNVDAKKDPKPPGAVFAGSPMPFFMRLNCPGVGMHQGFLPGVPDSHGCIRMPERMVKIYYENVSVGTPVRIVE